MKPYYIVSMDCGSAQSFDEAVEIARKYAERDIGTVRITGRDQHDMVAETAVCLPDGSIFGGKTSNKSESSEELTRIM